MIIEDDLVHSATSQTFEIEPSPPELLRDPLEFLFIEHYRHRQMCRILEHLADSDRLQVDLTATTLDFVRFELALHVIDEEEDLFPLLRRRCEPEDEIEDVLGRLSGQHASDQDQAKAVRGVLEKSLADARPIPEIPGGSKVLRAFAVHQRDHLALENAIVLPIARRRISATDLGAMSKRLAARRGIVL